MEAFCLQTLVQFLHWIFQSLRKKVWEGQKIFSINRVVAGMAMVLSEGIISFWVITDYFHLHSGNHMQVHIEVNPLVGLFFCVFQQRGSIVIGVFRNLCTFFFFTQASMLTEAQRDVCSPLLLPGSSGHSGWRLLTLHHFLWTDDGTNIEGCGRWIQKIVSSFPLLWSLQLP